MRLLASVGCVFLFGCSSSPGASGPVVVGGSGSAGSGSAAVGASPGGAAGGGATASAGVGGIEGSGVAGVGVSGADASAGLGGAAGAGGSESLGGSARAGTNSAGSGGSAGAATQPPKASGVLCVFDYDLTLSTNKCVKEQYDCRTNTCLTYNWYEQCMSTGAMHAIRECVERGAYIGIASHASVDVCWDDKVAPVISQTQFPDLTGAVRYDNPKTDFSYPKIDLRSNWNCDTCAYHMNGAFSKPQLISKVMAHYKLDPSKASDRAKVIFWDDLPDNITKTNADMPEVHTVHVHENIDGQPNSGGCGILDSDVTAGWAPFPK